MSTEKNKQLGAFVVRDQGQAARGCQARRPSWRPVPSDVTNGLWIRSQPLPTERASGGRSGPWSRTGR